VLLKLHELLDGLNGRTVGLLGLAFKQDTDDMREAPAITIAEYLKEHGATVRGYDPVATETALHVLPFLDMAKNPYELAKDVDAIIVMTPWNEFKQLDMARIKAAMKTPILIDGRNLYDPKQMRNIGFTYRGIGRGYNGEKLS